MRRGYAVSEWNRSHRTRVNLIKRKVQPLQSLLNAAPPSSSHHKVRFFDVRYYAYPFL
jgi:hypothetical protein